MFLWRKKITKFSFDDFIIEPFRKYNRDKVKGRQLILVFIENLKIFVKG